MKKKYKIGLFAISVLLVGCICLGTSYSIWMSTNVQEGINEVKVGCFRIKYTNLASYGGQQAGDINLVNAYPISDESGASLTPYMFNIKNECSVEADYSINLETLNTSNFNTEYLRVKFNNVDNVTNNNSQIYTSFEEGVIVLTEQSSASRKLATGHLQENEDATYSLRVWVDKSATTTTPNVMGKTWNGKVVVSAEAAPEPQPYTVVSGDLDTIGSVVKIANEEFYVIGQEDSSHVKLLSKWNLNVGDNAKGTPTGLQDGDVRGYRTDGGTTYGTVAFSSVNYWHDSSNNKMKDEYGGYIYGDEEYLNSSNNIINPYVYDSNASIKQYVDTYVTYLTNQGVNVSGRLIKFEELISLGCSESLIVCDSTHGGTAPEWVYQTSYWTGSVGTKNGLWVVSTGGGISNDTYLYANTKGVRPVIILEK